MSKYTIDLAKKLINIKSVKENTSALKKVLKLAQNELSKTNHKNFSSNNSPSIIFYNTKTLPKKFKLILNGHLDVVDGKPEQFRPYIKGDKLYGRGAIDMKGPAAVLIKVFKDVAKKVDYPLGLQLVTDEETGGFNGTKYQIEKGIKADFVLAGEATDFKVNNKTKGIIWVDITSKGKTAHGAYPWKGENAIFKMNVFLNTLYKSFPIPKDEMWKTTVNVSKINTTNDTYNKVPDSCSVSLDIRFIPEDKDKIIKDLRCLLPKDFELNIKIQESCQLTDESNEYIKKLQESLNKINGRKSSMLATHGGADIRHYNKAGINGVTFGPVGDGLHTNSEWVSIKSLEKYYEILIDFLHKIK
ncbi:M20/M25/M40 family metallo-hydrolase [Candidatus Woesebacteria bacterium]|nr:M20/M25/M40 family metallo-hydrolase [Candidatus Woesebacteria bacterium]